MDCADTKPLLPSYVRDAIGGPDRDAIEEHLASCDDCSLALDLLRHPPATAADAATDWTVERIFDGAPGPDPASIPGPGSADVNSAEPNPVQIPAPEPAAPAPAHSVPARAPLTAPESRTGEATQAPNSASSLSRPEAPDPGAGGWGFEPAGANVENAPPEESLHFAEEALGRRGDRARSRNAAIRAVVWGLGGVLGVGLLGASIWVAIRPSTPGDDLSVPPRAAVPAPPASGSTHATPEESLSPAPAAAGSTAVAAGGGETVLPPPAPSIAAERPAPPGRSAVAHTAAPSAAEREATPLPPKAPSSAMKSPPKAPPPPSPTRTTAPVVASGVPSGDVPPPSAPAPPTAAKRAPDDLDMWPVDDDVTRAKPSEPEAARTEDGSRSATVAPSDREAGAAPDAPPPTSPKPEGPRTEIDRLHAATEKASAEADLDALRRLKDAWKNHLKTAFGPDRSRAKREYADCLWAIQILTGRRDDQRDALVAYRDFLVNAPAGGSDARSAARLRQLEDASVERR